VVLGAGGRTARDAWLVLFVSGAVAHRRRLTQEAGGLADLVFIKQVAQAAMGGRAGGGQLGRFVIVVDDDIDPSDIDQVLWAVSTRCDPETSIDIIRNCTTNHLDPRLTPEKRAAHDYSAARAVIDACRPYHWRDQFPLTVGTSPERQSQVLKDWPELFR